MQNRTPYILGLNVNSNSIGWAVIDCKREKGTYQGIHTSYKPTYLRALNSRIFLEMLEAKTRVPKNQKRREARNVRNRRAYYKKRRKNLVNILLNAGLLPESFLQSPEKVLNAIDRKYAERKLGKSWSKSWHVTEKAYCSPYAMRNFSLEEKLEPYEFGRLLLHLQRRRGYFSNRGAKYIELIKSLHLVSPEDDQSRMSAEERKETGLVLTAIDQLGQTLEGRTLGQFIWQKSQKQQIAPHRISQFQFERSKTREGETVIEKLQFRASREMHEKEFDAIWKKQSTFHEFSKEETTEIKDSIFNQRPLRLQKGTVGNCSIYPKKKRAAVIRLEYQEFRTLQIINHLKVGEKPLSKKQRQELIALTNNPDSLNKQGRISWKNVAKVLGAKVKDLDWCEGDYEGEAKKGLIGNRTALAISHSIGVDAWHKLGEKKQTELVEDLHTMHNKKALYNRLVNYWNLSPYRPDSYHEHGALELTMNEQLEDNYGKYSLKAINELLPHLRAGLSLYAAMEVIGQRENIAKTLKSTNEDYLLKVEDVPNISNPIVQKALFELRRVVNSIVSRYGKPAIIRMEMAWEMKSSKLHRNIIANLQKQDREKNEVADNEILKNYKDGNIDINLEVIRGGSTCRISKHDRSKYLIWKEQGEKCPYCQGLIEINQLFSGEADIQHILPFTDFRQNHTNMLVSCHTCNNEKGQQTPYETWGQDEDRWQEIEAFAKEKFDEGSGRNKLSYILKKKHNPECESEFVERQLNDTRYITTASKKMLEKYGAPISVNNGAATREIRRRWSLNSVLPREPESDVYVETGEIINSETGEILRYSANKAEVSEKAGQDHRYHAINAFIVAMTDHAMLHSMVKLFKQEQDNGFLSYRTTQADQAKELRLQLPESWGDSKDLHSLLRERLNATVVSHMTKRKVWGALHQETYYGQSHFDFSLDIENMRTSTLKKVQQLAKAKPGDNREGWILDEDLRVYLLRWAKSSQHIMPSTRTLPYWKGEEQKTIVVQKPCMTVRKKLTDSVSLKLLSKLPKDWKPGKGTWIAEQSIHTTLYQWLEKNSIAGQKTSEIKKALSEAPPRILSKRGKPSTPILNVRIARPMTYAYRKVANSFVKLSSNHHLVLFHNGQEGPEKKRKLLIVTMLDAARRAGLGKPIIDKRPPPEWVGDWHYELDLCVNDMVCCEEKSIFEKSDNFTVEHRKTPYFRVQQMSSSGNGKIDLYLRHHSVPGSESNWGLWRIQSLHKLKFRKIQLGNLGLLPTV